LRQPGEKQRRRSWTKRKGGEKRWGFRSVSKKLEGEKVNRKTWQPGSEKEEKRGQGGQNGKE